MIPLVAAELSPPDEDGVEDMALASRAVVTTTVLDGIHADQRHYRRSQRRAAMGTGVSFG